MPYYPLGVAFLVRYRVHKIAIAEATIIVSIVKDTSGGTTVVDQAIFLDRISTEPEADRPPGRLLTSTTARSTSDSLPHSAATQ